MLFSSGTHRRIVRPRRHCIARRVKFDWIDVRLVALKTLDTAASPHVPHEGQFVATLKEKNSYSE